MKRVDNGKRDLWSDARPRHTPESVVGKAFVFSLILVGLMMLSQRVERINAGDLQRSEDILSTMSTSILQALTRITFYDKQDNYLSGCSGTLNRETDVLEGKMYTTILIGHCIADFQPDDTNVDLINPYMSEPIQAKTIMCEEYDATPFEDHVALCSFLSGQTDPKLVPLPASLINPDYNWTIGDVATIAGFPGQNNNYTAIENVVVADRGEVGRIGQPYRFLGDFTEVGCGDYHSFGGQSGGPQIVKDQLVAVNKGGCMGVSQLRGGTGADIPSDFDAFADRFYQASLCRAHGQTCE